MSEKVSVIMPAYNCSKFIDEAVISVIRQTYKNWELIVVDDCSTDGTWEKLRKYSETDKRITILKNEKNLGAAASRNRAVEKASGRYMAFLDSDDLWFPDKLEKQIDFMEKNNYAFSCTSYNKISPDGRNSGCVVKAVTVDYDGLLKHTAGNSTVMYDSVKLGKHTIPLIRKRNDYVMWLKIIKVAGKIYGLDEVLTSYRTGMQSVSSNKVSLVKYQWIVYRNIEHLSLVKSAYLVVYWIIKGIFHFQ